jgi:hypothetical protein
LDRFPKWLKRKAANMISIKYVLLFLLRAAVFLVERFWPEEQEEEEVLMPQNNQLEYSDNEEESEDEDIPVLRYSFASGSDLSMQSLLETSPGHEHIMHYYNNRGEDLLRTPIVASPLLMRGIIALTPRNSPARPIPLVRGDEVVPLEEQLVHHIILNRGRTVVDRQQPRLRTNKAEELRRAEILRKIEMAKVSKQRRWG